MAQMLIIPKYQDRQLAIGLTNKEFRCSCTNPSCRSTIVKQATLDAWTKFRTRVGIGVDVLSCYRCPQHNLHEGGAELSRHQLGEAIDFAYYTLENKFTYEELEKILKECGFTFVLLYKKKGFIHADTREV